MDIQLLDALDNLLDNELKKFQWHLTNKVLDGFTALRRGQLEKADRQDTVAKMMETYGDSGALKISAEILRRLNLNDEAQKLEPPVEKPTVSPPPQPAAELGVDRSGVLSQGSSDDVSKTSTRSSSPELGGGRPPRPAVGCPPNQKLGTVNPTIVTPELSSQSPEKYRLQCPHAGVFQCSLTGLVFQMKGEGDVQYSIVQWDEDLLASTGKTPAGPLFSIDCPQGSVCQLHLPHCEMVPGEGLGSLSVAHASGDNVELLPPLRVTDTHVVVNITDLSLWGLLRGYFPFITIRGKVFPFLESLGPLRSVLNVVVVPANVPLTEVISFFNMHKETSYKTASSVHCSLTRGGTYTLCCAETEKIEPQHAEVYWSYGPDYHHTFLMFLSADTDKVKLKLLDKDGGEQVWEAHVQLRGASSLGGRQTEPAQSGSAEERLRSARREFVNRVSKSVLSDLLDGLLDKKVLNGNETESVKVLPEKAERARVLIDMVLGKGDQPCSMMMKLLADLDSFLHSTLGFN